ncbi:MAG TPA: AAA family ATPase, partial [Dehalococcoidia bacterium]|nr:AAA family ATPase [Dehalococcoidia bacterium]
PAEAAALADAAALINQLADNIRRVVVLREETVRLALIGLLADGHLLLEDVPGVGKTLLARTIARSIDVSFRRIQFTPDLLPADITGSGVYNPQTGEFPFLPGPIFGQIVLCDEINRATPRTQSALLEAMGEGHVTVDGVVHPLPRPFLVIATENPVESYGTFPLPEAQLDRFLLSFGLGYPDPADEVEILDREERAEPEVNPVIGQAEVLALQARVRLVAVTRSIKEYVVAIVGATRTHHAVALGVSPRGAVALQRAAQARALTLGRGYVLPDDVKALAGAVLGHRLVLHSGARDEAAQVLDDVLDRIPVPL